MDLLKEAQRSNKEAYLALIEKYNTIFYKVTRVYFVFDIDIYHSLEKTLSISYNELMNIKTEREYLCKTLKKLISACEDTLKQHYKDNPEDAHIDPSKNAKYRMYKADSIVERCISSLENDFKMPALLYFYADLSINEISSILGMSKSEVRRRIERSKNNIFDTLDREKNTNNSNTQDSYIKTAFQQDKVLDTQLFERFSDNFSRSKIKVSSFTYGKAITIIVILLFIIIGLLLYLANIYFNFFDKVYAQIQNLVSNTNTVVDLPENTVVENIIENTIVNETTEETNEVVEENTIETENTINNTSANNTISSNTIGNSIYENTYTNETVIISPKKSDIDLKELQAFVEDFAIGINRISLTDESLESNTLLLYIARHYFDTHSSKSVDFDDSFAPIATNIHKYLTEFTGNDYTRIESIKSYNNYIGYASQSKSYVFGKDINNIKKEKYTVSDLEVTNDFNSVFTANAKVVREVDNQKTIYKLTFKFTLNNNYSYQKFCLKELKSSNMTTMPDNTVHLVNGSN